MAYHDMWTNNLRCQLLKAAETPATAANKLVCRSDFRKNVRFHPEKVPETVTHLDIAGNQFDDRYQVYIPDSVKCLNVSMTNFYNGVGFSVPLTLETLIHRGSYYPSIYSVPPALKVLDLSGQRIRWLPPLPDTLEVLILNECYFLEELPDWLPSNLCVLDLRSCRRLTSLPEVIPSSLKEIWVEGCEKLPQWARDHSWSYWDLPKTIRKNQEEVRKRQQKRCRDLRQEIVAAAYHPRRVERWLELKGWDVLEEMLG